MEGLLEPPKGYDVEVPEVRREPVDWFRVHPLPLAAVHFDRAQRNRFNAPTGTFGVLYVSSSPLGALAETLLTMPGRPPRVPESKLEARALSVIQMKRVLRLADFADTGLARLGLDGRIATDNCYEMARRWSRWVHDHPQKVDGILYRARNAPGTCSVALFEREDLVVESQVLEAPLCPRPGELSPRTLEFVEAFGVAVPPGGG